MAEQFRIGDRVIGPDAPTYFIADIAANREADLDRALRLITLAKEAGVDATKFQHFRAEHIFSDRGFRDLGGQQDHQATWTKSVFEVYDDSSPRLNWTDPVHQACRTKRCRLLRSLLDLE
jgi:N-acetylneuraminate synthase